MKRSLLNILILAPMAVGCFQVDSSSGVEESGGVEETSTAEELQGQDTSISSYNYQFSESSNGSECVTDAVNSDSFADFCTKLADHEFNDYCALILRGELYERLECDGEYAWTIGDDSAEEEVEEQIADTADTSEETSDVPVVTEVGETTDPSVVDPGNNEPSVGVLTEVGEVIADIATEPVVGTTDGIQVDGQVVAGTDITTVSPAIVDVMPENKNQLFELGVGTTAAATKLNINQVACAAYGTEIETQLQSNDFILFQQGRMNYRLHDSQTMALGANFAQIGCSASEFALPPVWKQIYPQADVRVLTPGERLVDLPIVGTMAQMTSISCSDVAEDYTGLFDSLSGTNALHLVRGSAVAYRRDTTYIWGEKVNVSSTWPQVVVVCE